MTDRKYFGLDSPSSMLRWLLGRQNCDERTRGGVEQKTTAVGLCSSLPLGDPRCSRCDLRPAIFLAPAGQEVVRGVTPALPARGDAAGWGTLGMRKCAATKSGINAGPIRKRIAVNGAGGDWCKPAKVALFASWAPKRGDGRERCLLCCAHWLGQPVLPIVAAG